MTKSTKGLVLWTPRVLCIAFALFLSVFALDVFEEAAGFGQTALALAMHLIPTAVVLVVLGLSWRWEWTGGVLFSALGVAYVATTWGRFHWSAYVAIAGPLFLLGALFLLNWRLRAQLRASS